MSKKPKLIRITTVPGSLSILLKGQLAFMKSNYEVIAISSGGKILTQVAKKEGVKVVPIEMSRTITPLKDLKVVWELYKLFKKEQPFIIHSHTPKAGIVGMLAAKLAKVPYRLHTVAGLPLLEATGFKRKVLNSVEKLTYSCATKVYPNSKGLEDIIIKHKFAKPQKLKVLANGSSNGINTNYFNPQLFTNTQNAALKQQLGVSVDDFVFIFVGRLVSDKGINELIEAFKKINTNNPNTKLVLVGRFENDLDPLLSKTENEINTNKSIIYAGYQQDVRPFFAIANALVFPSYREGFPNVVMQAGAMGLSSIVTNINGCNEIIIEGENGIIIPVKNADVLYKAMNTILTNTQLRTKFELNARELIVSRYEQKFVWKAILNEYKSLIEKYLKD